MTRPRGEGSGSLLITSVMLAEFAKVEPNNLVTIVGGGISTFTTSVLPAQLPISVSIQVSNLSDEHVEAPLLVLVKHPDGTGRARVVGKIGLAAKSEFSNLAFTIPVNVDVEGRWPVSVSFGEGEPEAEVWFNVKYSPAQ